MHGTRRSDINLTLPNLQIPPYPEGFHPADASIAATSFWNYEAALDQMCGDEACLLECLKALSFEANSDLREMSHILCQINACYDALVVFIHDIYTAVSSMSAEFQDGTEQHEFLTSLEHAVVTLIQDGITKRAVKSLQQVTFSRSLLVQPEASN